MLSQGAALCRVLVLLGLVAAVTPQKDATTFLDVSAQQNPLRRDTDLLPDDPDDKGDEADGGSLQFLLVSTFIAGSAGTGKVWVVPESNPGDSFMLVSGLDVPTGVCFDKNNKFLYVADSGLEGNNGRILQFQIDTNLRSRFILADYTVATIYEGPSPYDCWVDAYGNLYFVDSETNSTAIVSYLDLWSGVAGRERILYQQSDSNRQISAPVALQVEDSRTIFYVNNLDPEDAGLLNEASARSRSLKGGRIRTDLRVVRRPWGLAVTNSYVYYSTDDGSVWAYRRDDPNLYLKSTQFRQPRGMCKGGNRLYLADSDYGQVFSISLGSDQDREPRGVVRIQGAYEVYCLND